MKTITLGSYFVWTEIGGYRVDAEFYRPEHRDLVASLRGVSHRLLGQIAKMRRPQYRTTTAQDAGKLPRAIKFLSPTEVENQSVNWRDVREVPAEVWDEYPAGRAEKGDLLLEVKGDATKVYLLDEGMPSKTMISGSFQQLRLKQPKEQWYVYAVLLSGVWQRQRQRLQSNINIKYVDKEALQTVILPWPSDPIRVAIGHKVHVADLLRVNSSETFRSATNDLDTCVEQKINGDETMSASRLSEAPAWFDPAVVNPKRLDPDYYDPVLTVADRLLRKGGSLNWKRLRQVARVCNFGAYELTNHIRFVDETEPGAVPYVTVTNIADLTVDMETVPWIDAQTHRLLSASRCPAGTVLLSIAGTIGRAGVVPSFLVECNGNQAIAKISVLPEEMDPHYLAAYLNSTVGLAASAREAAGAVQKNLYIYNVEDLPIPCTTPELRQSIGDRLRAAETMRFRAKRLIRDAIVHVEQLVDGKLDEDKCLAEGRDLAKEFGLEMP